MRCDVAATQAEVCSSGNGIAESVSFGLVRLLGNLGASTQKHWHFSRLDKLGSKSRACLCRVMDQAEPLLLSRSGADLIAKQSSRQLPLIVESKASGAGGLGLRDPGFFSTLSFGWVGGLLASGFRQKQLSDIDLFELDHALLPAVCCRETFRAWRKTKVSDLYSKILLSAKGAHTFI